MIIVLFICLFFNMNYYAYLLGMRDIDIGIVR